MTKASACVVCGAFLSVQLYATNHGVAMTSLGDPIAGDVTLYFCDRCGHPQGAGVAEIAQFYRDDYHIHTANADDDDLYEIRNGQPVFRSAHQLETLLAKASIPQGGQVLDYGCAKAATLKRLVATRPDIKGHVFDVSDRYRSFWHSFLPDEAQSTFALPSSWAQKFDLVISFFAFEHIDTPAAALADIARVVKPGGTVYLVIPNALANPADFVVIDHVNHFTVPSMEMLLHRGGFDVVDIDLAAHHAAMVVVARYTGSQSLTWFPAAADVDAVRTRVEADCAYWRRLDESFSGLERGLGGAPFAIYGAGFYGRYVAAKLAHPERISCFIDQNPRLRDQKLMGRPIVGPKEISSDVRDIVVGLNPKVARDIIARMPELPPDRFRFHYI